MPAIFHVAPVLPLFQKAEDYYGNLNHMLWRIQTKTPKGLHVKGFLPSSPIFSTTEITSEQMGL